MPNPAYLLEASMNKRSQNTSTQAKKEDVVLGLFGFGNG